MTGTVVMLHNPFRPERGRDVIAVTEPLTIRAWLDARRVAAFDRPTICLRNGEPVLRGRWDETLIAENDLAVFVPLPQGGGGGKNPLRTVLMLAVMVAAPYLGGVIAGALGVTSAIGVSLITAGVTRRHHPGQCPAAAAQARCAQLRQGRAVSQSDLFAGRPG